MVIDFDRERAVRDIGIKMKALIDERLEEIMKLQTEPGDDANRRRLEAESELDGIKTAHAEIHRILTEARDPG